MSTGVKEMLQLCYNCTGLRLARLYISAHNPRNQAQVRVCRHADRLQAATSDN